MERDIPEMGVRRRACHSGGAARWRSSRRDNTRGGYGWRDGHSVGRRKESRSALCATRSEELCCGENSETEVTFRWVITWAARLRHSEWRADPSMLTAETRFHLAGSFGRRAARLARSAPAREKPAARRHATRAMTDVGAEPARRQGTCFCGAVRVEAVGEPMAISICHCVICRKMSGAPFSAQALFDGAKVSVHRARADDAEDDTSDAPEVLGFESSTRVERFRCARCASPVYATLAQGKTRAVPLAILDEHPDLPRLQPSHHMYYASRVLDSADDLPKFVASSGRNAKRWNGDTDE